MGDVSRGECEDDALIEPDSNSSVASDAFLERAPIRLFFNLNFSIQLELSITSGHVVVVEKARACRRICSSVRDMPFFSCSCISNAVSHVDDAHTWFLAQLASARSISGERPFGRLAGDRLPSSCCWRYFSFCRNTFDTVLDVVSVYTQQR